MSEFLPETGAGAPQADSVGSLLTPATLDISSGDIALMQKVLSAAARNPNLIPSDFMAYIVDYIQTSRLSIPIGQVFGYTQKQASLDYAQRTTSLGTSATTEGSADTFLSGNSVSYSGSDVIVEVFIPGSTYNQVNISDPSMDLIGVILRDNIPLGHVYLYRSTTTVGGTVVRAQGQAVTAWIKDTPSAGVHQYIFAVYVSSSANGTSASVLAGPGGSGQIAPAFLRVVPST